MAAVEQRVDRLEVVFEQFMRQTNIILAEFRAQAEKDRQQAEKDRAEAKRERRELARQLGDISNRLGTIVEDIIAPSLRRMMGHEFDCGQLEFFGRRIEKYHPVSRLRREFDVIGIGDKAILLNETKAYARPEYVKEAVSFLQSGEFFEYYPELRGKPLIPVFSSLYIPADIVAHLTRQGIYAVGMGDEAMTVLNLEAIREQNRT